MLHIQEQSSSFMDLMDNILYLQAKVTNFEFNFLNAIYRSRILSHSFLNGSRVLLINTLEHLRKEDAILGVDILCSPLPPPLKENKWQTVKYKQTMQSHS